MEIMDENGVFRSIARDVIVEVRLIAHMRVPYLEDREMMTFEKEDMRRRSSMQEKAEQLADGGMDSRSYGVENGRLKIRNVCLVWVESLP